ncbi:hypothetical protein BDW66DRAFT_58545 [Aspergillus desertorum]
MMNPRGAETAIQGRNGSARRVPVFREQGLSDLLLFVLLLSPSACKHDDDSRLSLIMPKGNPNPGFQILSLPPGPIQESLCLNLLSNPLREYLAELLLCLRPRGSLSKFMAVDSRRFVVYACSRLGESPACNAIVRDSRDIGHLIVRTGMIGRTDKF